MSRGESNYVNGHKVTKVFEMVRSIRDTPLLDDRSSKAQLRFMSKFGKGSEKVITSNILWTNNALTHSRSPQLIAVIKAIFESKLFCQGIFPRQDPEKNAKQQERARNYLFRILVTEYEAMGNKTFNRVCDYQMGVSYAGETLLQNVWKFYKVVYINNVSKMIKSVLFASPFVLGQRSVDSFSTKILGDFTPSVFKPLEAEFTVVGLTWGSDGDTNYDASGENGSYVKSIRAIFRAILKIHSLQVYIRSCGHDKLKSYTCLRGLNLDPLEALVSDEQVGSVVEAIRRVYVVKNDLEERVSHADNDDRLSLTTQEEVILQNLVDIVASIDRWIGSCQMQLFRAYMRNDWDVYWLNPIRTSVAGFYSIEDTLQHLNPKFMGFGAKVCDVLYFCLFYFSLYNRCLNRLYVSQLALGIVGGHFQKPKNAKDVLDIGEKILSEKIEGSKFSFYVRSMKKNLRFLKEPQQELIPQSRPGESDHGDVKITKELVVFLLQAAVLLTDERKCMKPYAIRGRLDDEDLRRAKTASREKSKNLHQQLSQQSSNFVFFLSGDSEGQSDSGQAGVHSSRHRSSSSHTEQSEPDDNDDKQSEQDDEDDKQSEQDDEDESEQDGEDGECGGGGGGRSGGQRGNQSTSDSEDECARGRGRSSHHISSSAIGCSSHQSVRGRSSSRDRRTHQRSENSSLPSASVRSKESGQSVRGRSSSRDRALPRSGGSTASQGEGGRRSSPSTRAERSSKESGQSVRGGSSSRDRALPRSGGSAVSQGEGGRS